MYTSVMSPERARLIQSEKMSVAGSLLAGIVHELNNPLTTILGFSELLLKDGKAVDPSRLEKIHSEAERSVKIVRNLLRLARAEAATPEIIDVNDAIRRTVDLAQYQLRLSRIQLETKLSSRTPVVFAQAGELTQVILNLVTNAIQAISSIRDSGNIRIKSAVTRQRVVISIIDDGPGIKQADTRRIFEPFFTTKAEGTGLGLSLSRNIIRENGGDLWASCNIDGGATFTIQLPLAPRAIPNVNKPVLEDPAGLDLDRSVLIADDDEHVAELIESALGRHGNQTERVSDGGQAIELLKAKAYDILVCDLHMPGIGGRELIEWARQNRPHTRILLLSGDVARNESSELAKKYGAHFLSKPFTVAELTKAVQRLAS
jgi:two-component system NtrC family sensor kinase